MTHFKPADLILNRDGSVFHLHLKPGEVAGHIILVGDPNRVPLVSSHFTRVDLKVSNREFLTHTGNYRGTPISVISTGIGTDNIDIVLNELDALVNIDLEKRIQKKEQNALHFYRIGTSGAIQKEIPVGSFLLSETAIGFDGLLNYYDGIHRISDPEIENAFMETVHWSKRLAVPYFVKASSHSLKLLEGPETIQGMTISAPGFYGPQGRVLRIPLPQPYLNQLIELFRYKGKKITNFEMESSAIFGLSRHLGHHAVTICAIIANRKTEDYLSDYQSIIDNLTAYVLDRIALT